MRVNSDENVLYIRMINVKCCDVVRDITKVFCEREKILLKYL